MISRRAVLAASLALGSGAISPLDHGALAQGSRVLQIVSPREITSLAPDDTGYHFRRLRVAETLVTTDPRGNLAPELAESWSVSEDGLRWSFVIRRNVRFHDGTALTPELVRDAVDVMRKSRNNTEMVSQLAITSVDADGSSVIVTLAKPFSLVPTFFTDGAAIILPPSAYAKDGTVSAIIGTGPYRINRINGKTSIELEAFPGYWGAQPHIPKVHFTGAVSPDTIANMAEAGQADLVLGLPQNLRDRVERSGRVRIKQVQTGRILGPIYNAADVRFDDPAERRAISLAVDRQGIAAALFKNPAAAANQLFSPAFPDWHDPALPPIEQNVEEARRLLAGVGWTPGRDGVLTRDGKRFSFKVITGRQPELGPFAQAVQAQLRDVGIEVLLETGTQAPVLESVANGTFVFGFTRRNYGAVPDPVATLLVDYAEESAAKAVWGGINYHNPGLESALNAYVAATKEEQRVVARDRLRLIVNGDMPVLPVVWYDYLVSVSKRVDYDSVPVDALELSFWIDRVKWAD